MLQVSEDTLRAPVNNRARHGGNGARSFWSWGSRPNPEDANGYLTPLTQAEDRSHYLELIDSKGSSVGRIPDGSNHRQTNSTVPRGSVVSSLLQRYDSIAGPSDVVLEDETKRNGRPWVRPSPAGAQLLARWQHEHSHQVFCNCGLGHCPLAPSQSHGSPPHSSLSSNDSAHSNVDSRHHQPVRSLSEGGHQEVTLSSSEDEGAHWHINRRPAVVSEAEERSSSSSSSAIGLRPLLSREINNGISADMLFSSAESNI